jgi:myo-inositol-1(or 4)-monophosphatase
VSESAGPPPPADLERIAAATARAAAHLVTGAYGRPRPVGRKSSPTDVVTQTDLRAEELVRAQLREATPGAGILGEERGETNPGARLQWVIDPLDGTINFLYGIPQWAVSVACEGVAGVVFDPNRDELFIAADGRAELNGEALQASRCDDLSRALVGTGFGYEAHVRRAQAEIVARVLPQVRDIRRAGSAALDLAWAAAGRLDAFYEFGVKPWDIAAGTLLCSAAGLEVRELQASDALPAGVLVAPPALVEPLLALVA